MSLNALGEAVRQGKEALCGSGALSAAGVLAVTTPFAQIDAVVATVNSSTAPETVSLSYSISGNVVSIRGWKVTAVDDATLIASDAEESVSYIILGRRR